MGPDGNGFTPEAVNPAALSGTNSPAISWRADAGLGGASPVVVKGVVYAIGAFDAGAEPGASSTPKTAAVPGNWAPRGADGKQSRLLCDVWVSAFSVADGTPLWRTKVSTEGMTDLLLPNASPLYEAGALFVRTPRHAAALDAATGKVRWTIELAERFGEQMFWMDGRNPPLMAAGGLILSKHVVTKWYEKDFNPSERHAICFALDPATGETLWTHEASPNNVLTYDPKTMPNETGYVGWEPVTAFGAVDGRPTIVMSTGHAAIGMDPKTGERLWIFHHAEQIDLIKKSVNDKDGVNKPNPWVWWAHYGYVPAQVIVRDGVVVERLFCGHGTLGTMTAAFEVSGGSPRLLWTTGELQSRNAKFIVHDGKLFGMDLYDHLHTYDKTPGAQKLVEWPRPHRPDDVRQFQCRDLRTGKLVWSSDAVYQGEKAAPAVFPCEDKKNPGHLAPCPALNDWVRTKPIEGGYSYPGDPTYILAGDTLVVKAARATLSGLAFARVTGEGLEKIGERPFYVGRSYLGEPVVAEGKLFVKLYNDDNLLEPGKTGTLACFDIGIK